MSNAHVMTVIVSVDVDRASNKYGLEAVKILDPTKRGYNVNVPNVNEADEQVSKTLALDLVRDLLNKELDPDQGYGQTTLRILSPKNFKEVEKQTHDLDFSDAKDVVNHG